MNHPEPHLPMADSECRLVVVQDELQPCPYLDGTIARMPLRLPVGTVSTIVTDRLLAMGFRRSGDFVYRTECPSCNECKPTRVDVRRFQRTHSMKRVFKRGRRDLSCTWGPPQVDQARVDLFNRHRAARDLGEGTVVDLDDYRSFLGDSCCQTAELSIYQDRHLVGVSIMDIGERSTSAVYTHFEPAAGRYSLGTYAVLEQIQWAAATQRQYVYLGMYVAENRHLNYKHRFLPQQRLIDGHWVDITQ